MDKNPIKNWMREAYKAGEIEKIPADLRDLVEKQMKKREEIIAKLLTSDKKVKVVDAS